ncbi:predicted protein [Nematostella vectensis]|uniref:G-protein coupled receptors family 1 profile domain-containing protein n=1 Tax=Nematostella vectensis TaxID=45351 RepID=A7RFM1_NEMVE|nr:predicted protein [Nematostella vectensis]|eukprot:XP_001641689.1 predicted protein [Nematostella vectensis]
MNQEFNEALQERRPATIAVEFAVFLVIILVTILGNTLVCVAIYRQPRLRSTTNYYVVALAVLDILTAALTMSLTLGVVLTGRWPYGDTLCQIQGYLVPQFGFAAIIIMFLISLNRYVKIIKSASYSKYFSHRKTIASILFALVSAVVGVFMLKTKFKFDPGKLFCFVDGENISRFASLAVALLFFVLPFALMCFFYLKIYLKIRHHKKQTAHMRRGPSTNDINATKTLFAVLLAFVLCYMQIPVIEAVRMFHGRLPREVFVFYSVMGGVSSAINVFIYHAMNSAFRAEFKAILRCSRRIVVHPAATSCDTGITLQTRSN